MGSDEHRVETFNARFLGMTSSISEATYPAGVVGRVKMSGAKMYIDDGTDWNLVTSA